MKWGGGKQGSPSKVLANSNPSLWSRNLGLDRYYSKWSKKCRLLKCCHIPGFKCRPRSPNHWKSTSGGCIVFPESPICDQCFKLTFHSDCCLSSWLSCYLEHIVSESMMLEGLHCTYGFVDIQCSQWILIISSSFITTTVQAWKRPARAVSSKPATVIVGLLWKMVI